MRKSTDPGITRARRIADIMDRAYIDPVLGLVAPGVGDIVSSALGLYVVGIAIDRGLPAVVVARMLINLGLDATIGAIPVLGDLFDFAFQAHSRNLSLLEARHAAGRSSPGDWLVIAGAVVAVGAMVVLPIYVAIRVVSWLF